MPFHSGHRTVCIPEKCEIEVYSVIILLQSFPLVIGKRLHTLWNQSQGTALEPVQRRDRKDLEEIISFIHVQWGFIFALFMSAHD